MLLILPDIWETTFLLSFTIRIRAELGSDHEDKGIWEGVQKRAGFYKESDTGFLYKTFE